MSLTVKACYEKPDGSTEVRRFAIDHDVSASFVYLSKKVQQIFPGNERKNLDFYWKDADGDAIAFSSDDELVTALTEVQNGVFKIFIREADKGNSNTSDTVHPGVICDGCEGRVVGIRYKCATCPDYDLCMTCEQKGTHAQHHMTRISEPQQLHAFFMRGGPWSHGRPCGPPRGGGPCGGPNGGPYGGPPFQQGDFPPWMRKCMRRWMQHANEEPATGEDAGAEGKPTEEKKEDGQDQDMKDILKNMGEFATNLLNQFGIDVDAYVHDPSTEGNGEPKPSTSKCTAGKTTGNGGKKSNSEAKTDVEMTEAVAQGAAGQTAAAPTTAAQTADGQTATGQTPAGQTVTGEQAQSSMETEEGDPVATDLKEAATDVTKFIVPCDKSTDGDWTLLTPADSNTQSAPAMDMDQTPAQSTSSGCTSQHTSGGVEMKHPSTGLYPQVPQEPEPLHKNPKINKSLQQMMAMGFSNEGDWLVRLLEAKDGDISQVLDAVQPTRRN